ncbi:hypothetical protein PLICRDRAFT_39193 [Plicaturopsis crispa FD-325 SS-3]|nr:hypothetical protein PLICRDRAFT_39193 [Plicaturopsis crispa FD-325 SS-3]
MLQVNLVGDMLSLEGQAKKLEAFEVDLLEQLRAVRQSLASVKSRIRNLLNRRAPISRLPDELLADIFAYGDPRRRTSQPSHIVASHVSQHWRQVALCNPGLWTRIWIGCHSCSIGFLDAHIERSRECLLDIDISHSRPKSAAIYDRLAAHAHRWSSLGINGGYLDVILPRIAHLSAPNLRHLQIHYFRKDEDSSASTPNAILQAGCPLLSSLEISLEIMTGYIQRVLWRDHCIPGVLPTLTRLKIDHCEISVEAIQDILRQTTSLQVLRVSFPGIIDFGTGPAHPPVNVPSLTTLDISLVAFSESPPLDWLPRFCSAVLTPNVEELGLEVHSDDGNGIEHFASWLHSMPASRHPFPRVHKLYLHPDATVTIPLALPNVTHLTVCPHFFDEPGGPYVTLKRVLGPSSGGTAPLWPSLHSLVLQVKHVNTLRSPRYDPSDIIDARIAAGCPIKYLAMTHGISVSEATIHSLKDRHVHFEQLPPDDPGV